MKRLNFFHKYLYAQVNNKKSRDSLAELVNAGDLKSLGLVPCGFESHGCRFFVFFYLS